MLIAHVIVAWAVSAEASNWLTVTSAINAEESSGGHQSSGGSRTAQYSISDNPFNTTGNEKMAACGLYRRGG